MMFEHKVMILFLGTDKPLDKPLTLKECFDIPDRFEPFVKDYKINLFEIAYLTDEKLKFFKSDFDIVADYFVQKQKNGEYKPEPKTIQHIQEVLQLLSVMTVDHRFEEAFDTESEGGPKNMCDVLDRVEKRGGAKGEIKGANMIMTLMEKLFAAVRISDAERATKDKEFLTSLLVEFGLKTQL